MIILPPGNSVTMDEYGGTFVSAAGPVLYLPPNALSGPTEITVVLSQAAPPASMNSLTPAYDLGPANLSLALPATIGLPLPDGTTEAVMYLSRVDQSGYDFELVAGAAIWNGQIHASIDHLGTVFAAVPPG